MGLLHALLDSWLQHAQQQHAASMVSGCPAPLLLLNSFVS
jgi:hypothetical protein